MRDDDLIQILLERREGATDKLLTQYGPLLRYVIRPILPTQEDREECLADVVLSVWEKIGQFDGERGGFSTWLTALARNNALNRLRAIQRRERGREEDDPGRPDPAPGPEEVLLRKERTQRLQQVIGQLHGVDRSLFYRKYYYLQSTAQMAAELGLTERAVEGRLRRLRLRLRKELGGEQDD